MPAQPDCGKQAGLSALQPGPQPCCHLPPPSPAQPLWPPPPLLPQDPDDDVQAVAAEALLPAAPLLGGDAVAPAAATVRRQLWDALLELEELSPATGSVLGLLAEVHSACPAAAAGSGASLGALVPRLWPFLRHGLTSVRHATLRCLHALLSSQPVAALLPGDELQRGARLLFQCLLLERQAEVLAAAQGAWQLLMRRAGPAALAAALPDPALCALFQLAATPAHSALDAALMVTVPLPRKRGGAGSSSKAQLAVQRGASSAALGAAAAAAEQQQQEARRRESLVVEADGDAARTTRMRLAAARALGQLARALGAGPSAPNPAQRQVEALLRGATAAGRLLGAYVAAHWAQPPGEPPCGLDPSPGSAPAADPCLQHLLGVLLEQLAVPAAAAARGYAELAQLHAQLRGQASGLIARALQAGVPLSMPGPLDALGHAGALALAAQVPAAAGERSTRARPAGLLGGESCLESASCRVGRPRPKGGRARRELGVALLQWSRQQGAVTDMGRGTCASQACKHPPAWAPGCGWTPAQPALPCAAPAAQSRLSWRWHSRRCRPRPACCRPARPCCTPALSLRWRWRPWRWPACRPS